MRWAFLLGLFCGYGFQVIFDCEARDSGLTSRSFKMAESTCTIFKGWTCEPTCKGVNSEAWDREGAIIL